MFKKLIPLSVAALASVATIAHAEEDWGTVGDWAIKVEPEAGNGCLMEKYYDNGVLLQFGLLPLRDGGFFAAYSEAWDFIEAGNTAPVAFKFDGIEFNGEVEGYIVEPWFGGFVFTNNPELVYDFAKKREMTVTAGENPPLTMDLDGTLAGVEELIRCQLSQDS